MGEIKRVLFKKTYIIPVLLLFIANIILFQYSQLGTLSIIRSPESLRGFVQELQDRQDKQHEDFYKKIERISDEKDRMLEISIFSDEDSFAYKNIIKTEKDYGNISGVELSDINDYAIECFFDYDAMYIIGFVIMLFTVITFIDERKLGLWQIIHTCSGGRLRLAVKRLIMLLGVSLITQTVLVISILVTCFVNYGGAGILFDSAQSVDRLQDFVLPVSLLCFFVYYVLFLSAALAVEGLFVWTVLSFIHNRNLGMILCVCVYVAEYFLYIFILPGNPLSILKYTNIYFFINPREIFTGYTNFAFAGLLFNLREYSGIIIMVLVLIFGACSIAGGIIVKPLYSPGLLETLADGIMRRCRRILCHFHGFGYEIYKMLVHKKGIVIFAVFLYLIITNVDKTLLFISPGRELLDQFYDTYTCEIDDASLKEYNRLEDTAKEIINNNTGEEGYEENAYVKMFELLNERLVYARSLEDRGIKGWFVNDKGYELLFGENSLFKRLLEGIVVIITVVLMVAPLYTSEYSAGTHIVVSSTRKGRGVVFRRKTIYGFGCAFLASVCMVSVQMYEVLLKYKLKGVGAPVQNIRMFEDVGFTISIGGLIVLWYAVRILTMQMCACIAMLISSYAKKIEHAYIVSLGLIPLCVVNGAPYYVTKMPCLILAAAPIIICIIVSGICLVYTYRRWLNIR